MRQLVIAVDCDDVLVPSTQKIVALYNQQYDTNVQLDGAHVPIPGVFTEIEHVGLDGSKGEVCQRLKADVLIDDNYKHLVSARECGVDSLVWFGDYPWQTQVDASGGAMRCRSWYEVQDEIKRITND